MANSNDWNDGYQAFVEGWVPHRRDEVRSAAWNAGYDAAKDEQALEVDAAERECIADYDNRQSRRASK